VFVQVPLQLVELPVVGQQMLPGAPLPAFSVQVSPVTQVSPIAPVHACPVGML
jgi:hypothetical protein